MKWPVLYSKTIVKKYRKFGSFAVSGVQDESFCYFYHFVSIYQGFNWVTWHTKGDKNTFCHIYNTLFILIILYVIFIVLSALSKDFLSYLQYFIIFYSFIMILVIIYLQYFLSYL